MLVPAQALVAPATAAATTAATEPPTTATTATPLGPRPRLVDGQGAAVHLLAVEGGDGRLRLLLTAHLHEAEALGAARVTVLDHLRRFHRPVRLEHLLQIAV